MCLRVAVVRMSAGPLVAHEQDGTFGGAEVRAVTFARGLAQSTDFDVTLFVEESDALLRDTLVDGKGAVRTIPRDTAGGILRLGQRLGRSAMRRLPNAKPPHFPYLAWQDFDVWLFFGIHAPTPSMIRSATGTGVTTVVALTSDLDATRALDPVNEASIRANARGRRLARDHRYALLQADGVMTQTQLQHDLVSGAGNDSRLILNPIELSSPQYPETNLGQREYVLWVGRADRDCKRADLCLEVARQCPSIPFLMVMNPTDPETTSELIESAPANVQIRSFVPWLESDGVFGRARALLNTSEHEGFPNAFLQAAKHGVPVLSRRVNPNGVLTRFGLGFLAGDDLSQLVAMTQRAWHAWPALEVVSKVARNYVVAHHDAAARARELADWLKRIHWTRANAVQQPTAA